MITPAGVTINDSELSSVRLTEKSSAEQQDFLALLTSALSDTEQGQTSGLTTPVGSDTLRTETDDDPPAPTPDDETPDNLFAAPLTPLLAADRMQTEEWAADVAKPDTSDAASAFAQAREETGKSVRPLVDNAETRQTITQITARDLSPAGTALPEDPAARPQSESASLSATTPTNAVPPDEGSTQWRQSLALSAMLSNAQREAGAGPVVRAVRASSAADEKSLRLPQRSPAAAPPDTRAPMQKTSLLQTGTLVAAPQNDMPSARGKSFAGRHSLSGAPERARANKNGAADPVALSLSARGESTRLPADTALREQVSATALASTTLKTVFPATPLPAPLSEAMLPATASAAPLLSGSPGTPEWRQDLGQHLTFFIRKEQQSAELQLHPRHLGQIHISLRLDDNQAQIQLVSPHSHIREALEAALPALRAQLAESGIQLGQSNIGSESFAKEQSSSFHQTGTLPAATDSGDNGDNSADATLSARVALPAGTRGSTVDIFA